MQKSENLNELGAALAKAQGELQPVKFNAKNPHLGNRYADLGAIIEGAKKPMADNGLSVSQLVVGGIDSKVEVTTILLHSSGQWLESTMSFEFAPEKGLKMAQVLGSVITYLRRYAYAAILGIYSEADDDGQNSGEKSGTKAKSESMVDAAKKEGGVVKKEYAGKLATLHKHEYPLEWGSPLMDAFVKTKTLNIPHLDGILQKLDLSFGVPVEDVVLAVNEYIKENSENKEPAEVE